MERWPSGRRRRFAKPLYGSYRIEGSNPSLSASLDNPPFLATYRAEKPESNQGFRPSSFISPDPTLANASLCPITPAHQIRFEDCV